MVVDALKDLLSIEFEWRGRFGQSRGLDCLGLAQEVRRRLLPDAEPLPDFEDVYERYDRESIPLDEVYVHMLASSRATPVDIPSVGCLAILDGTKGVALGTFIGDDFVILFGDNERPRIIKDYFLPTLLGYYAID